MNIASWCSTVFLLLVPFIGAVGGELDDYLQEVTTKNPAYKAAERRWQAATQQVGIVTALPDPKATLGVFAQEVETRVGPQKQRIGINQAIPWKGKLALKGHRAQEKANKAKAEMDAVRLGLVTEFMGLYGDYYYVGRSIDMTREHIKLLKDLEGVVTQRYQTNSAHYNDLIRIQIEIESLNDRLMTQTESALPIAAVMNALLGREPLQKLPFVIHLPILSIPKDWSEAEMVAGISVNNPGLTALDHQVAADRLSVSLAKKNYYPDFKVGLDWINTGDSLIPNAPESGKDAIMASIGVNLPIWRKKYRSIDRAAAFRVEASVQQREDAHAHLGARLKRAIFQLDDATRKLALFRDQIIPKAEESLNVITRSFQTGDTSYLDLIDAEKALLEFRLSFFLAEANRLKAVAAMERVLGEPPFPAHRGVKK